MKKNFLSCNMKRKRSLSSLTVKKGFTLVEMMVVIAIIAIMLAIVIPLFNTSTSLETEAKEYARSFYSNVQELFTDEKFNGNNVEFAGEYTLVCAKTDTDSGESTADVTVYVKDGLANIFALSTVDFGTLTPIDKSDASTDDKAEFANSLSKLLSSIERTGWFYAVVDSRSRVVCTYFSLTEAADYSAVAGEKFDSDCRIGDYIVGSYPYELCAGEKTMLVDITA